MLNNELFKSLWAEKNNSGNVCGGKKFSNVAPNTEYGVQDYYFECGCGSSHSVQEAFAVSDHRGNRRIVFSCPNNDRMLTIVDHKISFLNKSKGIETLASYYSEDSDEIYMQTFAFQRMKDKGQSSLKEQFESQMKGDF